MRQRMIVDCERCPVRGAACADCVVTAFLAMPPETDAPLPLDADERAAVSLLVGGGLVDVQDVAGLVAHREPFRLVRDVG